VRARKVRDQRDRAPGAFECCFECASLDQHPREIIVCHAVVGIQCNRPAVTGDCFRWPAGIAQRIAIVQVCIRQLGQSRQCPLDQLQGRR
jgi:hypothetical protein